MRLEAAEVVMPPIDLLRFAAPIKNCQGIKGARFSVPFEVRE
jgi:hypothetical protein